jgi:tetratricopeptide (TPR) repeat protein
MAAALQNVRDLLLAALERPPGERPAYLEAACGGDAALRGRVEALLKAHDQPGAFLSEPGPPADADTTDPPAGSAAGAVIAGRYTLLQRIGEGGMGEVWVARQTEPVKRTVALKLIKAGMDSRAVLARFEAERQALALMDHPNIARVLDGGMTAERRPFFAMELVNGVPLTRFCDEARLGIRERLELFAAICQAVQHAHQKGVIHRDLKPSNILVTLIDGRPVPKVIDFGVAKAVGGKLLDESPSTQFGAVVGTLEYMAPEQAGHSGSDIDTRADVYSLGVILYELLTGLRPLDARRLREAALDEVIRVIREEEPPSPSARLSADEALPTLAAARQVEPRKLLGLLRGELDWVVLKCLEKRRDRRYETASALARDVQRYLADEPVEARPPSAAYRLRKFVRRHPLELALAGALALLLVGGLAVAWWQNEQAGARRETDLRRRLEDERRSAADRARLGRNAEAVAALLGQAEEALRAPDAAKAKVALDAARKRSAEGGADEQAQRLGRLGADLALLRELDAIDQFRWTWSENQFPDPAVAARRTRGALKRFGADPDATSADDAAARVSASAVGGRIVVALDWLLRQQRSAAVRALLRLVDADPYRDAVRDALLADDRAKLVELVGQKAALEQPPGFAAFLGDSKAIPVERRRQLLLAAVSRRPGDLHVLMSLVLSYAIGQEGGANEHLRYVRYGRFSVRAGPGPLGQEGGANEHVRWSQAAVAAAPDNVAALNNLGVALWGKGQDDEAIPYFRKALALDPKHALAHTNLGLSLARQDQLDEAIRHLRKAVALTPKAGWLYSNLGAILVTKRREVDEAIACFRQAIALEPDNAKSHCNLGTALLEKDQVDGAIACFRKAIKLDSKDALAHKSLGDALYLKRQWDEAIACLQRAIKLDPTHALAHDSLGNALRANGEVDKAIACFREAIKLDPTNAKSHCNLGAALADNGEVDKAIACFRKAIKLDPTHAPAHNNLGAALAGNGEVDKAIACFRKAIKLDPKLAWGHLNLGNALMLKNESDEAIACYKKAIELDPTLPGVHALLDLALRQAVAAHTNRGTALARQGELDEAIASYQKAIALDPKDAPAHGGLGLARKLQGELDEAIASYKKALALDPEYPEAHCNLGHALAMQGRFAESVAALRRGHELGSKQPGWRYPSAAWVRQAEVLAALEAKLPAFLKGEFQPGDSKERLGLAEVCQAKKLHHAATGLYADAFAADPKLADAPLFLPHRYHAARCAALAAAGKGEDAAKLEDVEQARLRGQALAWLRADLRVWATLVEKGTPQLRAVTAKRLRHWQTDPDLAGMRDAAALGGLPQTERADWQRLWANVAALLKQLDEPPGKEVGGVHVVGKGLELRGRLDARTTDLLYQVKLQAGKTYVIDMVSPDPKALDPYLVLRDATGTKLAEDDDSGGGLNARITFRAAQDGTFRIQATSYNAGRGAFTLTVREQPMASKVEKEFQEKGNEEAAKLKRATEYQQAGKSDLALPLLVEVWKGKKARLGPDHLDTLNSMNQLGVVYWQLRQLDRSVPLFEELVKLREAKLGRGHLATLHSVANLGANYKDAGRLKEAMALLEEAQRAAQKYPELRWVAGQLLDAYAKAGENAKLDALLGAELSAARKALPPDSPQLAGLLAHGGLALLNLKRWAEAEPLLRECLAIREKKQPDAWTTFNTQSMLGGVLLGQKKYADAEPLLRAGYAGMKQREGTIPPQGRPRLVEAAERLVRLYETLGRNEEVARWTKELEATRAAQKKSEKKP